MTMNDALLMTSTLGTRTPTSAMIQLTAYANTSSSANAATASTNDPPRTRHPTSRPVSAMIASDSTL